MADKESEHPRVNSYNSFASTLLSPSSQVSNESDDLYTVTQPDGADKNNNELTGTTLAAGLFLDNREQDQEDNRERRPGPQPLQTDKQTPLSALHEPPTQPTKPRPSHSRKSSGLSRRDLSTTLETSSDVIGPLPPPSNLSTPYVSHPPSPFVLSSLSPFPSRAQSRVPSAHSIPHPFPVRTPTWPTRLPSGHFTRRESPWSSERRLARSPSVRPTTTATMPNGNRVDSMQLPLTDNSKKDRAESTMFSRVTEGGYLGRKYAGRLAELKIGGWKPMNTTLKRRIWFAGFCVVLVVSVLVAVAATTSAVPEYEPGLVPPRVR